MEEKKSKNIVIRFFKKIFSIIANTLDYLFNNAKIFQIPILGKTLSLDKKILVGGTVSTIVVALILFFGNSKNNFTAESAENMFFDQFFKWNTEVIDSTYEKDGALMGTEAYIDPNIIIADIDENTLQKMGSYYNWDRSVHAKVIEQLNKGGAAAVAFDILFKDADFGKKRGQQCYNNISHVLPDVDLTDSIRAEYLSHIQSDYNFDSMLVETTRNSQICIVSFLMNRASYYKNKSERDPLSSWERAKEVGLASTFQLNQVDKPQNIEHGQLLDNIFPELAKAGARLGSVNAYPDRDGSVRRVNMLYRFPVNEDKLAPQRIYSALSLMTILHLFHKDPKDVTIKMGEYIDVGKPFGIYRDSIGEYHTTFPNFTYPMFQALFQKMSEIKKSGVEKANQVEISSEITAKRNNDGQIVFGITIDEKQQLNATLSNLLRSLPESIFNKLDSTDNIKLDSIYTISKSEDEDGYYIITDNNDEEIIISPYALRTIHFYEKSYSNLKNEELKFLSRNMYISYNKAKNTWSASISFFTNSILQDIAKTTEKGISSLKPGEELRFGPYKKIPIDDHGQFLVKFKGRFNKIPQEIRTFKHKSYYDIYSGSTKLDQFAGKIIILGSSVPALFDIVNGPHEENIPAILVHANIVKNILEDDYLTVLQEKYQKLIVIFLVIICTLIGLYFRSFWSLICTLLIITLYTMFAYICFKHNIYIGVSKPIVAIITSNIFAMVIQAIYEFREKKKIEAEKQFIRNTFQQFLSEEVIEEIIQSGKMPQLGGQESVITAYFTDIQGFSTFSEQIGSADKLVKLLNEYLTVMTDVLMIKNKGTLDKYEGDAIIAFFGAPTPSNDHAKRACDTAIDMQNNLLELRKKWISEGDRWPKVVHDMHMRIGINTGKMVTGYMGTNIRKDYTMMGDEVNLAARLESIAKQYGAYIHVCKNTIDQLEEQGVSNLYIYRSLDIIRVVGKDEPVETFELLAYASDDSAMILNKLVSIWNEARKAYLAMEWDKAIALFTQCLDFEPHLPERDAGSKTCPSQVFIKRCMAYKQNPPAHAGEKWDGIFTATEK